MCGDIKIYEYESRHKENILIRGIKSFKGSNYELTLLDPDETPQNAVSHEGLHDLISPNEG